ncbi:MAG: hypothetical protein JXB26_11115 [Candidatus Aminicenantes bacterium]|nr:hypothetical protein [Candidatus Aminicenantes bacterium]
MSESKEKKVFDIVCPVCSSILWIDPCTGTVVRKERKAVKKKTSFDSLLLKEKKKKDETDRRFTATSEMEKERRKKAMDMYEKAFRKIDKD